MTDRGEVIAAVPKSETSLADQPAPPPPPAPAAAPPPREEGASLAELDRCVQTLGMKGLLLCTNLAGRFPDEPEFRPVLARAVELDIPVLLHPAKPLTTEFVKGYEMTSTLGNMFDNTIALTRLLQLPTVFTRSAT